MQALNLHLLLNHFPILGLLFGAILLLFGIFRKDYSLTQAAHLTFIVAAVLTMPVFFSGEGAEDALEALGASHDVIHEHEEIAEKAIWLVGILGLLSLLGFWWTKKEHPQKTILNGIILGLAILGFLLMGAVGNTGGKIRRPDMQQSFYLSEEYPKNIA